jgi:palmitoyltransferase
MFIFDLESLAILGIYLLVSVSCVYVILCADPNGNSIMSKMHRVIFLWFPEKLKRHSDFFLVRFLYCCSNYVCKSNNPIIEIFYLLIALGGYITYIHLGFRIHFPNSEVGFYHFYWGCVLAFFAFFSFYLVCSVGPG